MLLTSDVSMLEMVLNIGSAKQNIMYNPTCHIRFTIYIILYCHTSNENPSIVVVQIFHNLNDSDHVIDYLQVVIVIKVMWILIYL